MFKNYIQYISNEDTLEMYEDTNLCITGVTSQEGEKNTPRKEI